MATAPTTAAAQQLVVFELDRDPYAVRIEHVPEIIRHGEPREVASATRWITGGISLRRKITPLA